MSSGEFSGLIESYLDLKWHLDPVEATGAGLAQHDQRYGEYEAEDLRRSLAALRSLSGALEAVATDSLADEVDRTALLNDLRVTVNRFERERPQERNPLFWISHALDGLYLLLVLQDRTVEHRKHAVGERIRSLPGLLASAMGTLGRCPAVLMEAAVDMSESGAALVEQAAAELHVSTDPDTSAACTKARESLVAFSDHLRARLDDGEDAGIGIGEDAFNFRLHYQHALQASAPELWRFGQRLIDRAERELARVAASIDPGVAWPDLADKLRREHSVTDGLAAAYATEMERSYLFVKERDLVAVPEGSLNVVETPEYLRSVIPLAAYQPPGAFSQDQTGWFYVTPPDPSAAVVGARRSMRDRCLHELPGIALHEGYPGHHLQFLSAHAQPRLVRKVVMTPLTVEGWALYCEEMMGELGFYRNLEEEFFQRLAVLWRAVRVVIDVGLHTRGMTFSDAVQLLVERVHSDVGSAEAEVRRYSAYPAYQLCYALGSHELVALRNDYRRAAGSGYSQREFHAKVMEYGGLPVSLMRWGMELSG
ncbi:MAG: DUF885 domain-containing protein [Gemmatimonadota bacterium]|nr:MAG: DUF885 domain-containing protein [Gemmatimonadota bacterium]